MEPFKNAISADLVTLIGELVARHTGEVDGKAFSQPLISQLDALELKERVVLIADMLHAVLPDDGEKRADILLAMLHPDDLNHENAPSGLDGLCGWGIWPLTDVIGRYGLGDVGRSLEVLREMTKRGTSEFDIRPFVARSPDVALPIIASWVDDPNHHVRRLVSEGLRPRLPWGMRLNALIEDPGPTLPLLRSLRDDPSEYVRRSVANHLNDIAKDHPDLVAEIAADWSVDADANRKKLVRHACRTLIKQGHKPTLAVFGLHAPEIEEPNIRIVSRDVTLGGALELDVSFRSTSAEKQDLVVDYLVHHRKANGQLSPKVFKWTKLCARPGEIVSLSKRHAIVPITTRRYYSGDHAVSLRINGEDFGKELFSLLVPEG